MKNIKESKAKAKAILESALTATQELNQSEESDILRSIEKQLEYLMEALEHENDRFRLKDIIIGVYAAREFEYTHPEYAELLYEASGVSHDMKKNTI